jgi:F-type H+-transporting ATPase subunit b
MTFAHLTSVLDARILAGASEGGVEVDFDASLLVQMGLFLVLMLALKPLLFDPMLRLFEERERRIEGAKVQARHIDEKSAGALTEYETKMAAARASANAEGDKVRPEGAKAESELLAKVRATTAAALEEGKSKAQQEAAQVRATLKTEAQGLARDLASRVLGREVSG